MIPHWSRCTTTPPGPYLFLCNKSSRSRPLTTRLFNLLHRLRSEEGSRPVTLPAHCPTQMLFDPLSSSNVPASIVCCATISLFHARERQLEWAHTFWRVVVFSICWMPLIVGQCFAGGSHQIWDILKPKWIPSLGVQLMCYYEHSLMLTIVPILAATTIPSLFGHLPLCLVFKPTIQPKKQLLYSKGNLETFAEMTQYLKYTHEHNMIQRMPGCTIKCDGREW